MQIAARIIVWPFDFNLTINAWKNWFYGEGCVSNKSNNLRPPNPKGFYFSAEWGSSEPSLSKSVPQCVEANRRSRSITSLAFLA